MNNHSDNAKTPSLITLLFCSLAPVFSVVILVIISGLNSQRVSESEQSLVTGPENVATSSALSEGEVTTVAINEAQSAAQNESSFSPGLIIAGVLLVGLVLLKLISIVGCFFSWYLTWVYQSFETSLMIFIMGLQLVVMTFSLSFDLFGLGALVFAFVLIAQNFYIRAIWASSACRTHFNVTALVHS